MVNTESTLNLSEKFISSKLISDICLGAILILAFWLRFVGIEWGIPGVGDRIAASYRSDEWLVFHRLLLMKPNEWDFNTHTYTNGTLIFYLLGIIYKLLALTGFLKMGDSQAFYYQNPAEWGRFYWIGRFVMILIGTTATWVIYRAGRVAFTRRTALFAALFNAIIPLNVVSTKHMLIEPAATLWFALAIFFNFKIIRNSSWKYYFYSALTLGSACAVKINCTPLGVLLILAHLLGRLQSVSFKAVRYELLSPKLFFSLAVFAGTYLLCNPYLLFNFQEAFQQLQKNYGQYQGAWRYLGYGHGVSLTHLLPYGFGLGFYLVSIMACIGSVFFKKKEIGYLLTGLVLLFYLNSRTGTLVVKYHIVLLPFLVLITAYFFDQLLKARVRWIMFLTSFGLSMVIYNTLSLSLSYNRLFQREDARDQASEWIKKNVPPGASLGVFMEPYYQSPPFLYNQYFFTGKSPKWEIKLLNPVLNASKQLDKFEEMKPDYYVISSRENRFFNRLKSDFSKKDDWTKMESSLNKLGYQRVAVFENALENNGRRLLRGFPPEDWDQIFIQSRIYRQKS